MDSMKLRKLYSLTKKALDDFKMIESGDRIAVGISGGKDSLALLYALAGLRQFYSEKFEIIAVTVDAGYGEFNLLEIKNLCEQLDVDDECNDRSIPYLAVYDHHRTEHTNCEITDVADEVHQHRHQT